MATPPENATKTECEHGHALSGDNLALVRRRDRSVERVCRTCARQRSRDHFRRHYIPHPRLPRQPPAPRERRGPTPLIERILARLDRTGECWVWPGARSNGYGIVQRGRRGEGTVKVHRVVYEHEHGPVPSGLDVMHRCHNRACANPAHLEIGTRAENMAMSRDAGRLRRTEAH